MSRQACENSNVAQRVISQPLLCNKLEFWKQFASDLQIAKESVLIVAPYVRKTRVDLVMPIFEKIDRNVQVTVVTNDPETQDAYRCQSSIDSLMNIGWEFKYWPIFHEKVAVIDCKIAWTGSLNILSHGENSELMLRFTSENSVADILHHVRKEILNLARNNPIKLPLVPEDLSCPICGAGAYPEDSNSKKILTCKRYPDCRYKVFIQTEHTNSRYIRECGIEYEIQDLFAS